MPYEEFENVNAAPEVDWDTWEEPQEFPPLPQPGYYRGVIDQIRDKSRFTINSDNGAVERVNATLDIRIRGGKADDRLITFQRVSNMEFENRSTKKKSSQMVDLFKSANVQQPPRNNDDYERILDQLQDRGAPFSFQFDWRGFCNSCYEAGLKTAFDTDDIVEAKALAKLPENKKTTRDIAKAATKAKSSRGFPKVNGDVVEYFTCPTCNGEIRAQGNVTRFLKEMK